MRRLRGDSGTGHGDVVQDELLRLKKNGQFPDDLVNSLCNLPDVLTITDIKEITLGDCYYNQHDIF